MINICGYRREEEKIISNSVTSKFRRIKSFKKKEVSKKKKVSSGFNETTILKLEFMNVQPRRWQNSQFHPQRAFPILGMFLRLCLLVAANFSTVT